MLDIENLIKLLNNYSKEEELMIRKAFDYAKDKHANQFRQSGEPYITHPFAVACLLAELNLDVDTICAGLLHDTMEDCKVTREEISELFNDDIAMLVDGVSKISKLNIPTKEERNYANTRKIIIGLITDVRIILIKLCDRLHNMRTLRYKKDIFKQRENSLETMQIYAPFAYYLGTYRIKSELEDISMQYLYPEEYRRISEYKLNLEEESREILEEMLYNIKEMLLDKDIPNEIKVRTKNVYGIYKRCHEQGMKVNEIHDLLSLKIMVDNIANCYQTLGMIHSKYKPINGKFKDYIYNPKTNMYQSLHTTVFAPDDRFVQTQIRTFEMDKVASFGLAAYWKQNMGKSREEMQEELKDKIPIYKSLLEIDKAFTDNEEFVKKAYEELFCKMIYAYTTKGDVKQLPIGATVVDFAYNINTRIGNKMVGALVNNKPVSLDYKLKSKDIVKIITDSSQNGPDPSWLDTVKTTKAKVKILNYLNTNKK